jgi:predicted ATP-grasp superfamily ATP-dependent carboligase
MSEEHVLWAQHPNLDQPIMVVAFAGWNDAGDAATWALRHLRNRLDAFEFARIDAEEFYDFTEARPMVELDEGSRRILWPSNDFSATLSHDLVLVQGIEPHFRWRTFTDSVLEVARDLDVSMVVTLGALLAEVPHTRPVAVYGSSEDPEIAERLDLQQSTYEGPTGIIGVLNRRAQEVGIPTASLWASVPTYVSGAASPKAALALVERLEQLVGASIPVTDLQIAAAAYERQISELVAEDTDASEYLERLEQQYDDGQLDEPDPSALADEVEQFLRDLD